MMRRTFRLSFWVGTALLGGCAVARPPEGTDLRLAPRDPPIAVTTNLGAEPSSAAAPGAQEPTSASARALPLGIGFTASPNTFLLGGAIDFPVDVHLTAGPALQVGIDDDRLLFAPFAQLRYWFLDAADQPVLKPFVQGGVGVVYVDPQGGDSDWGGLLNIGGGVRLLTGDSYRVGSSALLNFVPGDVANESFYFSWEIVQFVFEF